MGRHSDYGNGMYRQIQEIMGRLESMEKELKDEKKEHKEDVCRLNDKIRGMEKKLEDKDRQIRILTDENERLKRRLNNDSTNSSMPPSSDRPVKPANHYNGREKSGKKPGGQKGHKGTTLTKKDVEEKIRSGKFLHKVETLGTPCGVYRTKYILDLEIVPVIREIRIYRDHIKGSLEQQYRPAVSYGPNIKAMAVDLYAEGVMSNDRICSFLNTVSGNALALSEGSVYGFCKDLSRKCSLYIGKPEEELLGEKTVCTDATVVTVNGKQAYIRNASTGNAVLYYAMESKGKEALDKIGFFTRFAGTLEHDHEAALYHYGSGHGECNVHLLRYLKKNTEEAGSSWAGELAGELCRMNEERKELMGKGERSFSKEKIEAYERRYDEILKEGWEQNHKTRGRLAGQEERTLLRRLEKYKENHLLFLHDFAVPFENNLSERDLRKCKNRQKMSGGFRKVSGIEMYCAILSIVETCKRKGIQVLDTIKKIFEGTPAIF